MVTKTGHMFHIDFAHFLGNVLKFGPIVRDKAPFVLTPGALVLRLRSFGGCHPLSNVVPPSEMVFVMGGRESQQFQRFIRLCCRAFNIVRKHANVFTNLFAMVRVLLVPRFLFRLPVSSTVGADDLERNPAAVEQERHEPLGQGPGA